MSVMGKRTELLIRAFLCPVCPFRQQELLQARGIVAREQCCVLIMCLPVSARFISAVLVVWAGLSLREGLLISTEMGASAAFSCLLNFAVKFSLNTNQCSNRSHKEENKD